MTTFAFDLSPLKDQLVSIMKDCMKVARSEMTRAVDDPQIRSPKSNEEHMSFLRDQILENATVLLPIIDSEAMNQCKGKPEFYLIVCGVSPRIKASVLYGHPADKKKVELVYSNGSSTPISALKKLLDVTMQLVQTHVFDAKNLEDGFAVKIAGGGYFKREYNSPDALGDAIFWGKSPDPSPMPGFDNRFYSRSNTGDENGNKIYGAAAKGEGLAVPGHYDVDSPFVVFPPSRDMNGGAGRPVQATKRDGFMGANGGLNASFNGFSTNGMFNGVQYTNKSFDNGVRATGWE
ncbi:hypothetical protein KC332_g13546 [Hortaea werneckii]|uniref:Uncharacterized protein n=1 Tax=Hortaea werneckii TaxID=91943 RepID=A0A3M7I7F3_HORWE|nr:hypothetical protein KC350_g14482 [Hortaea werneckii]KAI6806879.1 hypothetical protein KC358_g13662 [Hortaea werneckii]KAI6908850.1 hypothetical protein KC348_g13711 [Hortaea werneckii]KAI6925565.1 hypothetical protein KC341_g13327 [Hortaea werneckii]KAI6959338.1 hypothetical protein KC321_g13481 [Hortaea werneckii]